MNKKLITALTPTDKKGELDKRFENSLLNVVSSVKPKVLERLEDFMEKQGSLEREFHKDAFQLALAFNNEAKALESNRDNYGRPQTGRANQLRESVRKGLQNLGFKSGNASKISIAAEFATSRIGFSDIDKWLASLGVSHLHVLSRMSEEGIQAAAKEVTYEDFHLCAGAKDISVRRLEEIQRKYPKNLVTEQQSETSDSVAKESLIQSAETNEVAFLPNPQGDPVEIPTKTVIAEVLSDPEDSDGNYAEKRDLFFRLLSDYSFIEKLLLEEGVKEELNPHNSLLETIAEKSRSSITDWKPTYV